MISLVVHLIVGVGLVLFGRHNRRNSARWVPVQLPAEEQAHRVRVLVRGAWACQAAGVLFVLMVIPQFVTA